MAGTIIGGKKAAKRNKKLHGLDFYSRIGKIGGSRSNNGGFASGEAGRARARTAGSSGGALSKRGYKFIKENIRSRSYIHLATGKRVRFEK